MNRVGETTGPSPAAVEHAVLFVLPGAECLPQRLVVRAGQLEWGIQQSTCSDWCKLHHCSASECRPGRTRRQREWRAVAGRQSRGRSWQREVRVRGVVVCG